MVFTFKKYPYPEHSQANIEIVPFVGGFSRCRLFCFYGVSDMKGLSPEEKRFVILWCVVGILELVFFTICIVLDKVL